MVFMKAADLFKLQPEAGSRAFAPWFPRATLPGVKCWAKSASRGEKRGDVSTGFEVTSV